MGYTTERDLPLLSGLGLFSQEQLVERLSFKLKSVLKKQGQLLVWALPQAVASPASHVS